MNAFTEVSYSPLDQTLQNMKDLLTKTFPEPTRMVMESYRVGGDDAEAISLNQAFDMGMTFVRNVLFALEHVGKTDCAFEALTARQHLYSLFKLDGAYGTSFGECVQKKIEKHRVPGSTMRYIVEMQLVKTARAEYSTDLLALRIVQAVINENASLNVGVGTFEVILDENVTRADKPDISNLN